MKGTCLLLIGAACLAAGSNVGAQSTNGSASVQNAASLRTEANAVAPVSGLVADTNSIVQKKITVSGPLVQPFKAKRFRDFPRRLAHLINPFAPSEPKPEIPRVENLSPRAWSTTVGWHPGDSAFPDPVTHEPSMSLISFTRSN